jgi:hypothetical protein
MPDLSEVSVEDLIAEMQRRAAEEKLAQYAPLRDTYEPLHGFMDEEQPLTLSQLLVLIASPRPQGDPDSAVEQNLSALRRVLANTKTVWDKTVGVAFDVPDDPPA